MRIGSDRDTHHSCQAKVCQLDHVGLHIDEQVLRLQVSVEDASLVAVGYSLSDLNGVDGVIRAKDSEMGSEKTNLVEEASDDAGVHHLVLVQVVEEALQVHREVLEDEVESVLLHDDVLKAHYVRLAQLLNTQ